MRRPRRVAAAVCTALAAGALASVGLAGGADAVTRVHLTASGDFGARGTTAAALEVVAGLAPDAHLALGDLGYTDVATETEWCDFVKARTGPSFPFELVSGNHESYDLRQGDVNDYAACLPNQVPGLVGTYGREYYLDFPRTSPLVRVIQVSAGLTFEDGKWLYAPGDAHWQWLSDAIDGGRAAGARWVVVTTHVPCLSVGEYACPAPAGRGFYQLVLDKRVDLVLHGHEHGYMRTHQLRAGAACPALVVNAFDPGCVADSDSAFTAGAGTVFATVGTGGVPGRAVDPADPEARYFAATAGDPATGPFGALDLDVTDTALAARFVGVPGSTFTDAFTLTGDGTVPRAPYPAMTVRPTGLTLAVDGARSTDADGPVTAWAWDFGDGTTATGVSASHTYAAAGTYQVRLTVTDASGATASFTRPVTVTPPVTTLASDSFDRPAGAGWGTAPVGGAWTLSLPSAFTTDGADGLVTLAAGASRAATLRSVTTTSASTLVRFTADKPATGGGFFVGAVPRAVRTAGDYRALAHVRSDGRVGLRLVRTTATNVVTALGPEVVVPAVLFAPGTQLALRAEAVGVGPTTVRARIWDAARVEPTTWQASVTDGTAGLQAAGSVGLRPNAPTSVTNAPITVRVRSFEATAP